MKLDKHVCLFFISKVSQDHLVLIVAIINQEEALLFQETEFLRSVVCYFISQSFQEIVSFLQQNVAFSAVLTCIKTQTECAWSFTLQLSASISLVS